MLALTWLSQVVIEGQSVNQILLIKQQSLSSQDQALAKQLLFGSLRFFHQLKLMAESLLDKPLKKKDADILLVIILGLYQLKYLSTPDHAALSESVNLAKKQGKPWAAGLVNAILRRYQREKESLQQRLAQSLTFQHSHPSWIVEKLEQDWPDDFEKILLSNNQKAPMIIRVNNLRVSRNDYLKQLLSEQIPAKLHPLALDAIVLDKAVDVNQLPGFSVGDVTVQDAAAQLVVEMLDLQPNQRVLDACAAPGGKTTHILQREKRVDLTAIDISSQRLEKIQQTLSRMQLNCQLIASDLKNLSEWWDEQLFDRILLDAPCSASGVIRRNPDIKIHRQVTDIKPLQQLQKELLNTAWDILKPGGLLVYATCSVFKSENQNQIQDFLASKNAKITRLPIVVNEQFNQRAELGYQIFPGELDMDGFYFCGLRKV